MPKFKLDEHFGNRIKRLFLNHDYDAETVNDENLNGAADQHLFEVCQRELRCIISLDLDFSDIIRFPPYNTYGIVILRPRKRTSIEDIEILFNQLFEFLKTHSPENQLWILESGKIRIHKQNTD